jgi:hypothetical protein
MLAHGQLIISGFIFPGILFFCPMEMWKGISSRIGEICSLKRVFFIVAMPDSQVPLLALIHFNYSGLIMLDLI